MALSGKKLAGWLNLMVVGALAWALLSRQRNVYLLLAVGIAVWLGYVCFEIVFGEVNWR